MHHIWNFGSCSRDQFSALKPNLTHLSSVLLLCTKRSIEFNCKLIDWFLYGYNSGFLLVWTTQIFKFYNFKLIMIPVYNIYFSTLSFSVVSYSSQNCQIFNLTGGKMYKIYVEECKNVDIKSLVFRKGDLVAQ